jgi:hypothetical protein
LFPFLDTAGRDAEREEFFFVVNHSLTALAGERVILQQENGLLRADFLAKAAKMQRSMLISNSFGIFSAFGRSASWPDGPGGMILMARGGHTNSQSWQLTHLVLPS